MQNQDTVTQTRIIQNLVGPVDVITLTEVFDKLETKLVRDLDEFKIRPKCLHKFVMGTGFNATLVEVSTHLDVCNFGGGGSS